jgi:hypothetical protein
MKRAMFVSLSLVVLGWIGGCGAYNAGGGGNPAPNAFKGQYAILLAGVDSTGFPLGIAGSITADGVSKITGGEVDVNDNGIIGSSNAVTGTYSFDTAGQSTIGNITLTNTVNNVSHPLVFAFSLQGSGAFGEIMDVDTNLFFATGTMQKQDSSAFSLSSLAGNYIVTINGRPEVNPVSTLGRFTLNSAGASSSALFDRSEAGSTTGSATSTSASVALGGGGPDTTNGRGTLTLAITDSFGATSQTYAYYAVNATRIVAVETDALGSMTADFFGLGSSVPSTVATTGSVFGMAGVDTSTASDIAAVGQMVITGTGSNTGTVNWDASDNGAAVTASAAGQAVTYDSNTGRGTLTVTNGTTKDLSNNVVFYLTAPGKGFILDATPGTTNRAMAGILTPQAAGPFSAATDLSGMGIVRGRGASANDPFSLVGLFTPSTTAGPYELIYDDRFVNNNAIQTPIEGSITGITLAPAIDTTGRGTFTNPDTNAFYVIGPNQFVFIDITQGSFPDLFIVDPH